MTEPKPAVALSRHLVDAHHLIVRLNSEPDVELPQVRAKDMVAEALAAAEHSGYLKRQREEGEAAWAVSVLDAYAEKTGFGEAPAPRKEKHGIQSQRYSVLIRGAWYYGDNPDAARVAAAKALSAADSSLPQRREGT